MNAQTRKTTILSLDVGGTTIDGAIVTEDGTVVANPHRIESPQQKSADDIVESLLTLLRALKREAEERALLVRAVTIGMPGPFDYENGISHMEHKFRTLYGRNIKEPLEQALGVPIFFLNDAFAFTLGAWWREGKETERFLAVTLGTGLGSGFLVNGRRAEKADGAPKNGEVWNTPFRDGILEDAVSRRGIERAYREHGGRGEITVREIAERARRGEKQAHATFEEFAEALGEGIAIAAEKFRPNRIVLGGQISKAFDLFGAKAEEVFAKRTGFPVSFASVEDENLALSGAARYAITKIRETE